MKNYNAITNGPPFKTDMQVLLRHLERILWIPRQLQLAHLFIQEARITGAHSHYYQAAIRILDDLLNINSDKLSADQQFMTLSTKAGVHLSLHHFQKNLTLGQEAMQLNKYNAQIYGLLVDANVELGRYKRAVELADQMVAIRPDLRSYARISYLREIHGDVRGAIQALEMAVAAGFPIYEETAWARLTLGELYERYGIEKEALMTYESILQDRPNYPLPSLRWHILPRLREGMQRLKHSSIKRAALFRKWDSTLPKLRSAWKPVVRNKPRALQMRCSTCWQMILTTDTIWIWSTLMFIGSLGRTPSQP